MKRKINNIKLKDLELLVKPIFEEYKITRDNDYILYYTLLRKQGYNVKTSLEDFLLHNNKYPNYDSVSRCRRKIQETNPELSGSNKKARIEKEQEYIDYATNQN